VTIWNPNSTPNFSQAEMACTCGQCAGLSDMDGHFMLKLQVLRSEIGLPFHMLSAFRCPLHPKERGKSRPGSHAAGLAADILAGGPLQYEIIARARRLGLVGIGIAKSFIHVDGGHPWAYRPTVWTY